MNILGFNEINDALKWSDFHDSGLVALSFSFLDETDFSYKNRIILDIQVVFKDNPDQPRLVRINFSPVSDIQINAIMDDVCFSESSGIYSLIEENGKIELTTIKGWKLQFKSEEIKCVMLT